MARMGRRIAAGFATAEVRDLADGGRRLGDMEKGFGKGLRPWSVVVAWP